MDYCVTCTTIIIPLSVVSTVACSVVKGLSQGRTVAAVLQGVVGVVLKLFFKKKFFNQLV